MIKIVIADDHPIFRQGIKQAVELVPNCKIVAEASTGMEAYHYILSELPNIAILDLEMPILNGLDLSIKIKKELSDVKIIVLTMHKEKHYYDEAMKAGVNGYLLKDNAIEELIACIKSVQKGGKFVSQHIETFLIEADHQAGVSKIFEQLTPTERVVLKLIAEGKKSVDIASLLFCSPHTVDNHRANMAKKLQLDGEKNALLKFAMSIKQWL